jgi:hypothetical protein
LDEDPALFSAERFLALEQVRIMDFKPEFLREETKLRTAELARAGVEGC